MLSSQLFVKLLLPYYGFIQNISCTVSKMFPQSINAVLLDVSFENNKAYYGKAATKVARTQFFIKKDTTKTGKTFFFLALTITLSFSDVLTFKNQSIYGNIFKMKFIIFSIFRETMTLSKIRMLLLILKAFMVTFSK